MTLCFTSISFPNGSPVDGDYWILDTDYESYSVVYSCSQVAFLKLELGWILTREANPSEATVSELLIKSTHSSNATTLCQRSTWVWPSSRAKESG